MSWAYCEPKSSTSTRSLRCCGGNVRGRGVGGHGGRSASCRETEHYRTAAGSPLVAAIRAAIRRVAGPDCERLIVKASRPKNIRTGCERANSADERRRHLRPRPGGDGAGAARLGDVTVVAPAIEQSGVGHSITFLTPLMAAEVFDGERRRGWAVEGSPADCVKLAIGRFCPRRPDLIVSGINGGLNIGINVLYSGTVAGATEGALFGIPSVAVSLEYDEQAEVRPGGGAGGRLDRADRRAAGRRVRAAVQYQHPDGGARPADGGPRGADGDRPLAGRLRRADRSEGTALLLGDGYAADRGRRRVDGPGSDRSKVMSRSRRCGSIARNTNDWKN